MNLQSVRSSLQPCALWFIIQGSCCWDLLKPQLHQDCCNQQSSSSQMRFEQEDSLLHNEADSCSYCILSKSLHKVFNSLKATSRANHSLWTTLTSIKYLRLVIKASVTLIHAELIKFTAIKIIWLFQKEPVAIAQNANISSSQYIVSTIKLIKVDYTLHRVKRLVIIDSEWMNCNHEQVKKWINCISQKKQMFTYTLQCVGSEVKKTIYDQQNQRTHLVQQALNSSNFV